MSQRRITLGSATLIALTIGLLAGQEDAPPPSGRRGGAQNAAGGRGARGAASTREFLGLGAAPDPVAAERGQKLYAPACAFCHGEKATGAEGPDLVRSPLVLHDEKGELIGPVLLKGRPDKGMPAFSSFTPEQVHDIAQFLHMRVELTANRGTYQNLNVVTGDAEKGRAYFNGAGGCNGCHSPTGDLAHISTKLAPDQLQNKFLWPGAGGGRGFGEEAPKKRVTVTLSTGEAITGTLKRLDDFNVSILDSSGNYRSWPRENGLKVEVEDRLAGHRKLLAQYSDADIHNLTAYLVTLK